MEVAAGSGGGEGHAPNSSPSSTHSSEFYDCDVTEAELEISPRDKAQVDDDNDDEPKGACGTFT